MEDLAQTFLIFGLGIAALFVVILYTEHRSAVKERQRRRDAMDAYAKQIKGIREHQAKTASVATKATTIKTRDRRVNVERGDTVYQDNSDDAYLTGLMVGNLLSQNQPITPVYVATQPTYSSSDNLSSSSTYDYSSDDSSSSCDSGSSDSGSCDSGSSSSD